jgi:uncharacterized lipoprotein YmbA
MKLLPTLLFPLWVAGCSVLKPIADEPVRHLLESSVPARVPTLSSPVIAIARPSLPPYLERSELVTRTGNGQLKVHENDLWSEPLDAAIARVIAESLRHLAGSTNIQPSGNFISQEYSSVVEIRIDRFDPSPEGLLLLECTWKAQAVQGGDASARVFRTEVAFDPSVDPMSRRVVAMNEALGRLAREIAKVL